MKTNIKALACVAVSLSIPFSEAEESSGKSEQKPTGIKTVSWKDLNQAKLPTSLSYREITVAKYQHLGFEDSEIKVILQRKAELQSENQDWIVVDPVLAERRVPLKLGELPSDTTLGVFKWPAIEITINQKLVKSGRVDDLAQVLSEELMHSSQGYSYDLNRYVVIPEGEKKLEEQIKVYQKKISAIRLKLRAIDPDLYDLSPDEVKDKLEVELSLHSSLAKKGNELISDSLSTSIDSLMKFGDDITEKELLVRFNTVQELTNSELEIPLFSLADQIKYAQKIKLPKPLLDKLAELKVKDDSTKERIKYLEQLNLTHSQFKRLIANSYYVNATNEIDPRLAEVNFAWMSKVKSEEGKPRVILNKEEAGKALKWFLQEVFEKDSVFESRQEFIKALIDSIAKDKRDDLMELLQERMTFIASTNEESLSNHI